MKIFLLMIVIGMPMQLLANPLGVILGGRESRGKIEGEYRPDLQHEEEKKLSGDSRYYGKQGSVFLKLYKTDESDFFLTGNFNEVFLGANSVFVGEGPTQVSGKLQTITGGLGYKRKYFDDSAMVISAEYGSSSDKPFEDSRDTVFSANFVYAFSPGIYSQWILFVNYSNNRPFLNNIPLPAFAYIYRPSKGLAVTFGLPFVSVNYFDFPKQTFNLFLSPGGTGYDIAFGLIGPLQIYNKFNFGVQTFMHQNRINNEDRLLLEEKTAEIGLRSPVARWLSLQISSGYSFDRFYYEGKGLFQEIGNKSRIPNDFFIRSKITLRF